jgi:hypothetical protein
MKKYEPIQIYLENNSTQLLVLDSKNISLPIENKKVLYNLMSKGIAGRSALYAVGTIPAVAVAFLCGGVLGSVALAVFCGHAGCPECGGMRFALSGLCASAVSIIAIPIIGAFDVSAAHTYNKNLYRDLSEKLLCTGDSLNIPIHTAINRVMFIQKKHAKNLFAISVIGLNGNTIARFDCKA